MTVLDPTVDDTGTGGPPPMVHTVCRLCYPEPRPGNVAYCGSLTTGDRYPLSRVQCIVCARMTGCPKCRLGL